MASLNSLPFVIETRIENRVLLNSVSGSQFTTFSLKKPLDRGNVRSLSWGKERVLWGNNKLVRAKSSESGDGKNDVVVDDDTETALQAANEKSKKDFAMRRELLQKQIAEKRKVLSSIKSSSINSDDELFTKDSESTSPEIDIGLNHKSVANVYPNNIPSGKDVNLAPSTKQNGDELLKAPSKTRMDSTKQKEVMMPSKSNGYFGDGRKEDTVNSSLEQTPFTVDSVRKPEKIRTLSDFLSKPSQSSSHKDEKDQKLEESTSREMSNPAIDLDSEDAKPPPLAGANVMNVILVAAECAPWVKTGGLGDVAGALPKALARRGHRVMVVVPRYGNYAEPQDSGITKRYWVDGQDMEVRYFQTYIDGVDFVFIDSPMFHDKENNIYGGSRLDILRRMVLFCKAAIEVPWHVPCGGVCYGDGNLVFIANDWHTALLPVYLKAYYRDNGLMKYTRSVLVIHNIAHQGRGPVDDFSYVDLPPHYIDYFKLYDPVGGEHFNIFAAGLKAADRIVTVSRGYSWELKTQEGGWGLHGIINENDWKLRGIVNGIDTKDWSPQFDVHLKSDGYTNYTLETLKPGKAQCKAALQKELGLPIRDDIPLIGFIGRLDPQKGVDLIAEAVPWLMGQNVQLVMLGSGRPELEQMLRQFESQHQDSIRGWVGFSVKTSHRITAGADILLMPSRFEPCGLNQLYAMNYGTIPVVHAVGGLRDTVQPFDPFSETGFGWTFDRAETERLIHALGNCLFTFREYKQSWEGLQRRGMMQDLSWDNAAQHYEEELVAAKYQW